MISLIPRYGFTYKKHIIDLVATLITSIFHLTSSLSTDQSPLICHILQIPDFSGFLTHTTSLTNLLRPSTFSSLLKTLAHSSFTCPCSNSSIVTSKPPKFLPPISSISWSRFWSISTIPLTCRTLWYRLIHNRIPHRGLPHHIFPDKFATNICPRCSTASDSLSHFFINCPPVRLVWLHFLPSLTDSPPSEISSFLSTLLTGIQSLSSLLTEKPSSVPNFASLSYSQIFIYVLQVIWSNHWAFIFHDTPFLYINIILSATRLLDKLDSELNLNYNL